MSNDKLFVGQERMWGGGNVFKITAIGEKKALCRYSDDNELPDRIEYILTKSQELKPEPKRIKLCAFENERGELVVDKEDSNWHSPWTKKNLVVIDGEIFVEEN